MKKYKKTKQKITKIGNYDLVQTTYTPDPKGKTKIKILPPVVIELDDDETSKKK